MHVMVKRPTARNASKKLEDGKETRVPGLERPLWTSRKGYLDPSVLDGELR